MKKKRVSVKSINKELHVLRKNVIEVPVYKKNHKNVVEKVLERKKKRVNNDIQGYGSTQVLKIPRKKIKYDQELDAVEHELKRLDTTEFKRVKMKKSVPIGIVKPRKPKPIEIVKKAKLFSIFDKVLTKEEKEWAKKEALREVKAAGKRVKAPNNELARIDEELKD
tara:strand:- start:13702 stop:14199 length:498 start_codon:yes stop_codon:yes gene_type:complete